MLVTSNRSAKTIIDLYIKYNFDEKINDKICRVSDTPLTYRQANSLDTDNLLGHKRANKKNWRKFSLKELVYIQILFDLKKFGMKHNQLKPLKDSFFKEAKNPFNINSKTNITEADIALTFVFAGIDINICLDGKGDIYYFTPDRVMNIIENTVPLIKINLNSSLNNLLIKGHEKPIQVVSSLQQLIAETSIPMNSKKEEELLNIVRDNSFSSVKVKKINGEISIAYAERHSPEGEINIKELEKLIEAKEFQNVQLIKRDGKIVNYKIEETFKL